MVLLKGRRTLNKLSEGLFVHRLGCGTVYAERTVRFCYRPQRQYRGMVAEVARKAHYLEVGGSNPSPTTLLKLVTIENANKVNLDNSLQSIKIAN